MKENSHIFDINVFYWKSNYHLSVLKKKYQPDVNTDKCIDMYNNVGNLHLTFA